MTPKEAIKQFEHFKHSIDHSTLVTGARYKNHSKYGLAQSIEYSNSPPQKTVTLTIRRIITP